MPAFRCFAGRNRAGIRFAALMITLSTSIWTPATANDRKLLLGLELNGRTTDTVVEATDHDSQIGITESDLRAIGLQVPAALSHGADNTVPLADLPGVSYRVDEHRQVLAVTAADRALLPNEIRSADQPAIPVAAPGYGAVLNYDVLGTAGRGGGISGLFDSRAYTPYGVASSSWLARQGFNGQTGGHTAVRLDTVLAQADVDGLRRWRLGDVVTGGLGWTRPFRLGGFQVASDFTIRPDLVTYPLPDLSGRASVPSTVDVLINGVRAVSQTVPSGPFALRQPPVVTGAGDIAVVVRDATGAETVRNLSFYTSPVLLTQGLAAYSVEGGLVRTGYGLVSDSYEHPALTGTVRYGLTDWITAEAHAEGSAAVQMGGAGAAIDVAGFGLLSGSFATSRASDRGGRTGAQASLGFERAGRTISVSLSATRATKGFRDVPSSTGDPVPRTTMHAGFGLAMGVWGNLNAAFVLSDGGLVTTQEYGLNTLRPGRARLASVSYSRPITQAISFYATAYRDFASKDASGINIGLTVALGDRRSASVSGALNGGKPAGYFDAAQGAVEPGDIGWHASLSENPGLGQQQLLEANSIQPWGVLTAGAEHVGTNFNSRAGIAGSVALDGGSLFAARKIEDSFAVVDTQGLSGVTVMRENRVVGRTSADGELLVPDLHGWESNRLSLDPAGMPGDVEVGSLERIVRPNDHSGTRVRFNVRRGTSAVIRLVDASGKPLARGSTATLVRTKEEVPVGFDGEIFLRDLAADETLSVVAPTGTCTAHFHFAPIAGDIPSIGPITCNKEAS